MMVLVPKVRCDDLGYGLWVGSFARCPQSRVSLPPKSFFRELENKMNI